MEGWSDRGSPQRSPGATTRAGASVADRQRTGPLLLERLSLRDRLEPPATAGVPRRRSGGRAFRLGGGAPSDGDPRMRDRASFLTQIDSAIGNGIESAVRLKHRRRLRRLGWERALEPDGDRLWAAGDPPPRSGCRLDVLVDGAEAFPAIAEAIEGARDSVHMMVWHVAASFELVPGERRAVLGHLLAEAAQRVDVRVLVWAGAPLPAFHPTRAEVREAVRSL